MRKGIVFSVFGVAALLVLLFNFQSPASAVSASALVPANDNCAGAVDLGPTLNETGTARAQGIDTSTATTPATDPCISCCFFGVGQNSNSVWYKIAPGAGKFVYFITAANYDTVVAVWTTVGNVCPVGTFTPMPPLSTCVNAPGVTEVTCNDDIPPGSIDESATLQSKVNFGPTAAATTYYIEVAECTGTAAGFGGTLGYNVQVSSR